MFSPLDKKWFVAAKKADFKRNAEKFHMNIVLARLIRNRDVITDEAIQRYLYGSAEDFYSPWHLKDMDRAVKILSEKIDTGKHIRIFGDYDIDGVTASYILYKGFKRLGVTCSIRIPHRIHDGYGVNEVMIHEALAEGVDTILTCDNGIAASAEFALAKEKGLTVLVTDHHEVPYEMHDGEKKYLLPPADAIIDPAREDCHYENKRLCGAAVALKLITALFETYRIPAREIEDYYELAAIATVGDVMDLQDENRILVKEGLKRLPYSKNMGLRSLIKATGLEGKPISAYHIGFVLGPCINAGGRLETALLALELLMCDNPHEAEKKAARLVAMNEKRKEMTEEGVLEGIDWVENAEPSLPEIAAASGGIDRVLVVYLPHCHESLAGIIAGRLRERYGRPSFVLTDGKEGVKGSGRSIEEYSMYEELVKCKHLMTKFGGHPMAAGLSLPKENIEAFRRELNKNCTLTVSDLSPKIHVDAPLPFGLISEELIHELGMLEPFGKGNTKPVFACKNIQVISAYLVGKNKNVLKMRLADEYGQVRDAVYFGGSEAAQTLHKKVGSRPVLDAITYYPDLNEFNGIRTIQLIVQEYR